MLFVFGSTLLYSENAELMSHSLLFTNTHSVSLNIILERDITKNEEIKKLVHEIKRSAILLQRSKPSDWNLLMETAMGIV